MARPPSIDENALLDTARAVFLEKGFSVTTAEIAQRAGVSEGTLFHRFGSKAGLFQAAMTRGVAAPLAELDLPSRIGKGEIEVQVIEIVDRIVQVLIDVVPCAMMAWSNRTEGGLPDILKSPNPPPLRVLRALCGYFDGEIRAGRLRPVDPEILARATMGGAWQYAFMETLGTLHGQLPLPRSMYVRGLADIILHGTMPMSAATPAKPASSSASQPKKNRG